ncbi:hypothetical protein BHE74_00005871 [Ensete ventricosum]|uniref:Uncharacterized protein n=1 Tax=Ensete ventricosum TaxID=4639 RepID=A0A444GF39_ENSVE|nr:hypothetical protein B296_00002231 [Ensete ventricosum]RWW33488.1 hypothetical protein GW17_00001797 [Ensete ventricosum]RWW85438.1 hypothetical protein BHE74_00005871 [Ensete ventricosum]
MTKSYTESDGLRLRKPYLEKILGPDTRKEQKNSCQNNTGSDPESRLGKNVPSTGKSDQLKKHAVVGDETVQESSKSIHSGGAFSIPTELGMGDAFDDWLIEKIQLLRRGVGENRTVSPASWQRTATLPQRGVRKITATHARTSPPRLPLAQPPRPPSSLPGPGKQKPMVSASLSLQYAPFSSLPLSPSHAANEAATPSVIASRPWWTAANLRPQPIRGLSSSSSSACSSGRLVALARASFPKISSAIDEDPATEKFLRNNSISDFMRFKKGQVGGHSGELQTAVVTYRKRFPWSLLHPFLEVVLAAFFLLLLLLLTASFWL